MQFESVSIIIGATDEDESLRKTVESIMNSCDAEDIARIIIVISANASQGCRNAIEYLKNKYGDVVYSMVQKRKYVGGAIRDGFDIAQSSHLMLLPADLAIGLECVPEMIERVKQHPDVIAKTSRWMKCDAFHGYSTAKKLLNRAAQVFLRVLFQENLSDFTNSVQTFPSYVHKTGNWQEEGFPYLLEMVLLPLRMGVKFQEFPANCYGREEGESKNSAIRTAMYMKTALRIRFTPKNKLFRVTK